MACPRRLAGSRLWEPGATAGLPGHLALAQSPVPARDRHGSVPGARPHTAPAGARGHQSASRFPGCRSPSRCASGRPSRHLSRPPPGHLEIAGDGRCRRRRRDPCSSARCRHSHARRHRCLAVPHRRVPRLHGRPPRHRRVHARPDPRPSGRTPRFPVREVRPRHPVHRRSPRNRGHRPSPGRRRYHRGQHRPPGNCCHRVRHRPRAHYGLRGRSPPRPGRVYRHQCGPRCLVRRCLVRRYRRPGGPASPLPRFHLPRLLPGRQQHNKNTGRATSPTGSGPTSEDVRRRPTLPRGPPRSTIGAEELNFRVRNGTGCFPFAMATETLWRCRAPQLTRNQVPGRYGRPHLRNRTVDACKTK